MGPVRLGPHGHLPSPAPPRQGRLPASVSLRAQAGCPDWAAAASGCQAVWSSGPWASEPPGKGDRRAGPWVLPQGVGPWVCREAPRGWAIRRRVHRSVRDPRGSQGAPLVPGSSPRLCGAALDFLCRQTPSAPVSGRWLCFSRVGSLRPREQRGRSRGRRRTRSARVLIRDVSPPPTALVHGPRGGGLAGP